MWGSSLQASTCHGLLPLVNSHPPLLTCLIYLHCPLFSHLLISIPMCYRGASLCPKLVHLIKWTGNHTNSASCFAWCFSTQKAAYMSCIDQSVCWEKMENIEKCRQVALCLFIYLFIYLTLDPVHSGVILGVIKTIFMVYIGDLPKLKAYGTLKF